MWRPTNKYPHPEYYYGSLNRKVLQSDKQRTPQPGPADDFDLHKSWYKMMFKKLHDHGKSEGKQV